MKITIVLYSSFYPFLLLTFVKRVTSILRKMKRIVVVLIINLMLHHNSIGQNLVPNPSFENYSSCPTSSGYIYEAPPWFQPRIWNGNTTNGSSSDFYNTCSNSLNPQAGIPSNDFGYQYARTGDGYAGIYVSFGYTYAEYIEVPLSAPLIANRKYCLSFYVSLSAKYWLATSNIGAYFSTDSLLFVSYSPNVIDSVIPQIDNPSSNILNDTANWMLVSGSFIAAGGEKFMTIGNFHDSINATFQSLPWGQGDAAYYYFDDFSMVDCTNVGINERTGEEIISIYPNPATTSISITSTNNIKEIKLINLLGEEVIVRNYELGISPSTPLRVTDAVSVDISSASKGIYFVEITDVKENVINRKVVVQ